MSDFSARILDDILNGKNVVMSSKMSLVSDEVDDEVEDEEVLDELEEVNELDGVDDEVSEDVVKDEEVLDELDDVENTDIDELNDEEVSEDEEILNELDTVDEVLTVASPSEELKAFSQLEETVDNFIINSDIDFSAHPKLKEFAQKFTGELETIIDELRQEKNDSLFEGVVSSKKVAIKADKDYKDYKDIEVETAYLIADCLRNCKEISLVDTNNNIIENTNSFVIDLEDSNESFVVKVTSRGKVAVSKKAVKADSTNIKAFSFKVGSDYEFDQASVREVDIADNKGTFELAVHVSDQKTYVYKVSFTSDKIDKVVPKNKVEKGAFSEDVFNDVKKFLNSNFFKDKLNQKILLDK